MTEAELQKRTESVFTGTAAICIACLFFFGLLLDGGVISDPARFFYLPMAAYLFLRIAIWKILRSVPALTSFQARVICWVPVYGFVAMWFISGLIRQLRL